VGRRGYRQNGAENRRSSSKSSSQKRRSSNGIDFERNCYVIRKQVETPSVRQARLLHHIFPAHLGLQRAADTMAGGILSRSQRRSPQKHLLLGALLYAKTSHWNLAHRSGSWRITRDHTLRRNINWMQPESLLSQRALAGYQEMRRSSSRRQRLAMMTTSLSC